MSELSIYSEQAGERVLNTDDPARIQQELRLRGVAFDRCANRAELAHDADQKAILSTYAEEIQEIQALGDYPTVDAIRMTPDHPDRQALRVSVYLPGGVTSASWLPCDGSRAAAPAP